MDHEHNYGKNLCIVMNNNFSVDLPNLSTIFTKDCFKTII